MERLDAQLLGYPIVTIEDAIVAMDVAARFYGTEQTGRRSMARNWCCAT